MIRHHPITGQFFHEQISQVGFYRIHGKLEVHKSLLNMVLHERPEIKTRDEAGRMKRRWRVVLLRSQG